MKGLPSISASPLIVAIVARAHGHDGGAHGRAAEGDGEAGRQQNDGHLGRGLVPDQGSEAAGIGREQRHEQRPAAGDADGAIDQKEAYEARKGLPLVPYGLEGNPHAPSPPALNSFMMRRRGQAGQYGVPPHAAGAPHCVS